MATKNFYFPSKTGSYKIAAGELRLKIYYSATTDSDVNMDVDITSLGDIKIPLNTKPASQTRRYSSFQVEFYNKDNTLITNNVLLESKKDETYLQIILDGSVIWDGKLDWDGTRKKEWYDSYYQTIRMKFLDKIIALLDYDLSDASYADDMSFTTLLTNIADLIDMDYEIPNGYSIEEFSGYSRSFSDFKLIDLDDTTNCIDFLKLFADGFALDFFGYDNKIYFVQRTGLATQAITDTPYKFEKIETKDVIKYVSVKATKTWDATTNVHQKTYGTESEKTEENIDIDGTDLLANVYCPAPSTPPDKNPDPAEQIDSSANNNYVVFDGSTVDLTSSTDGVCESGMRFEMDDGSNQTWISYVTQIIDENHLYVVDVSGDYGDIDGSDNATINRAHIGTQKLYKVDPIVRKTAESLSDFYISTDKYRIELPGILKPIKKYTYNSQNFIAKSATIRLIYNETFMDVVDIS